MNKQMKLEDLLKETDALTYINSLKVTLSELKAEFSTIEEMHNYSTHAVERSRKLLKKADNQYRLIAKLVQGSQPYTSDELSVDESILELGIEKLMENENG